MRRRLSPVAMTLDEALAEHLAAIRARDAVRLRATVADDVVVVTARGEIRRGADVFLAMQEEWFRVPTWSIATRPLARRVADDLALCILELVYPDRPPQAAPIEETSIPAVGFARDGERWLLVSDQNTPCA